MTSVANNRLNFNPKLKLNYKGGNLTSDAGLLLYKEFDHLIGFTSSIKAHLNITDTRSYYHHSNQGMVTQKIYQLIAGYEADDCADSLINEPLFCQLLGKNALASQPSLARLNKRFNEDSLKSFESLHWNLMDRIYTFDKPKQVILDIDSTHFSTYGNQEDTAFNYHYKATGYHPLMVFDGLTGDLLKANLRPGNVYTSTDVCEFIQPVITWYEKNYCNTELFLRGDSGFAKPELYDLLEDENVKYTIRLKANNKLHQLANNLDIRLMDYCKQKDNLYDYAVLYEETIYQASSWSKPRKVIIKVEKPTGQIAINHMFLVTNMELPSKNIVAFYANRGTMENFIKEGKNGFCFDGTSSSSFITNANKLQMAMLAYNFNNWFRRLCFDIRDKHLRMESIRSKVIKVAAKITSHAREIIISLCSSYPYKHIFGKILSNLHKLHRRE